MRARRMMMWAGTFCAGALVAAGLLECTSKQAPIPGLKEARYVAPFPLQQAGEHLDILVWMMDTKRAYEFNFVMAQRRDWPKERRDKVALIDEGQVNYGSGEPVMPYPVKLRLRIDAMDEANEVHIDEVVSERSPHYLQDKEKGAVLWRAQALYAAGFKPGVYRVRLENLVALPQIDFQTFFVFERDSRK